VPHKGSEHSLGLPSCIWPSLCGETGEESKLKVTGTSEIQKQTQNTFAVNPSVSEMDLSSLQLQPCSHLSLRVAGSQCTPFCSC